MERISKIRIIIQSIVMILIGSFLIFFLHHRLFGYIIGGSGLIVFILGVFVKPAANSFIWLQKKIMKGVSIILTWLLLVPFYYICFVPGRIMLLLLRKDPLNRKILNNEKSYWSRYTGNCEIEQCKRQF